MLPQVGFKVKPAAVIQCSTRLNKQLIDERQSVVVCKERLSRFAICFRRTFPRRVNIWEICNNTVKRTEGGAQQIALYNVDARA